MSFFKEIFGEESNNKKEPLTSIRLTKENIIFFPTIEAWFKDGKVKFDSVGRLRYLHGAPVGDMILIRVNKDGTPVYKVSAEGWFDPDSPIAKDFVWL